MQKEGSNLAYRAELEETISSVCGNWRSSSKQSRRRIQAVPNHVQVAYQDQTANLPLQIIKGKGASLFGRNWLRDIKLNWGSIKKIICDLDNVLTKHKSVFNDQLGTMQGTKASLPFGRASRVEGYMSRVRVICRGSKKKK